MRLSDILMAITATTIFATANALSAVADSKITAVATSDVVHSLKTNVEPKRMLRAYEDYDEYDYLNSNNSLDTDDELDSDDALDSDDELDSDDALNSNDEERARPVNFSVSKRLLNKMLNNPKLADKNMASWATQGVTQTATKKLLRLLQSDRYKSLLPKYEAARRAALGKKVPQLP
ncbi:hypothetical protein PHYBOEH_000835 [Phytophthora boehmeriae]|uniref:RxLR effector protein n=1 Tax=Phytophthora boehmeriae TaxID=109152 RepID=A0A8T1X095_9STRA|nr:hypothetical protein PHYBOEH_000835 [Phytophthora boehmeriae]